MTDKHTPGPWTFDEATGAIRGADYVIARPRYEFDARLIAAVKNYRVTWEIDVEAASPREAAELARMYQTKPGTSAVVFDCADENGEITRVDLLEAQP